MPCDSHGMSRKLARPEGFEPPTPRFVVWCFFSQAESTVRVAQRDGEARNNRTLPENAQLGRADCPRVASLQHQIFEGDFGESLTEFTTTGNSRKQRGSKEGWLRFAGYADAATRKRLTKLPAAQSSTSYWGDGFGRSRFRGAASRRRDVSRPAGAADARGLRRSGSRRRVAPCLASYEPVTNPDQCSISSRRALK